MILSKAAFSLERASAESLQHPSFPRKRKERLKGNLDTPLHPLHTNHTITPGLRSFFCTINISQVFKVLGMCPWAALTRL